MPKKRKGTKKGMVKGRKRFLDAPVLVPVLVNMPRSIAEMFKDIADDQSITVSHAIVRFILESLESK